MELVELKASLREETGNGPARTLRREGKLPVILYGPDTENTKLSVSAHDLQNIIKKSKGSQLLVNLVVENGGQANHSAMLKELQVHPVSRSLIHADFYAISMDRKIHVTVPVTTTGSSKGVEEGGILQVVRRELEAYCYPNKIPDSVIVDVTDMEIGDSVHIEDIEVEGVEFPAEVNFTVVTVSVPHREELPEEGEEEVEEGLEAGEEGEESAAGEEEPEE
ncbi:MAG: 50S ribosomal protein L25 [Thermodesulfobacteriota bacterium]